MTELGSQQTSDVGGLTMPGPYKIVGATSFGIFLGALDASIVNVSLVTIAGSLGVTMTETQWIVLSYLLVITSLMPLMGKLGDRFGKTKVFQIGMLVFITGSLFCALSPGLLFLVSSRVFQALGASMMTANGLALVTYFTTPQNRGRAIGLNSIVLAAALGFGPVVGGILSQYLGWQSIFLINLPIGVLGFMVVQRIVPETALVEETTFDALGAGLFFTFLFTLIYSVSVAATTELIVSIILVAIIISSFVAFVVRETRFAAPIIPARLLADRRISSSIFSALLAYMAIVPLTFLFPFFLQEELGFTQSMTGLVLTAHPIVISVVGPFAGFMSERVKARHQTVFGLVVQLLGLLFIGLSVPNIPLIIVGIVIMGFGLSTFSVANGNFIMTSAPREYMGVISALTNIARTTGFSVATALVTMIFLTYRVAAPYTQSFQWTIWTFCFLALVAGIISAFRGLSPAEEGKTIQIES
ncbi:MAG: MFS transporter [Candidatus Thorarchaeota archaeon]|jgi:EmrB/QacA subfamily drug resistance transporter